MSPSLPARDRTITKLNIAVIGLGVVGGSLLRNLAASGINHAGFDVDERQVAAASRAGLVTASTAHNAARGADLVFLCVPESALESAASAVMPHVAVGAGVVATSSTMGAPLDALIAAKAKTGRPDVQAAVAHPMAGSALTGFAASSLALFESSTWALSSALNTGEKVDRPLLRQLAEIAHASGASRVERLVPDIHDRAVAAASHAVQCASTALAGVVGEFAAWNPDVPVFELAAGGWRDTTRIAESAAHVWVPVLTANSKHVAPLLDDLIDRLSAMREAVAAGDGLAVERLIREGNQARTAWARQREEIAS